MPSLSKHAPVQAPMVVRKQRFAVGARCAVGLLLLAAMSLVSAFPAASRAAPRPAPTFAVCAPSTTDGEGFESRDRCVAHRSMRARGRLEARCLTPLAQLMQVYPSATYCGGSPEFIAQSRAIRLFDPAGAGGAPGREVQWEHQLPQRPDITVERDGSLDVYEVKRTKFKRA